MGIRIALAGNPNSGKTTLFNALTGSNQYVGNWPGVTVEKKEGKLKRNKDITLCDLPGIYSLSPYTLEEVVARNYLLEERPDAILNIVDGTNLERNLYLTTQLLEIGIPVVIAVNMIDAVEKAGDKINVEILSKKLGCPVVEISALKNTGINEAADAAIEAASNKGRVPHHIFSGAVEHALAHIEEAILHDYPLENQRWYAIKIFEHDEKVIEALNIPKATIEHINEDIKATEIELDDDAESIITNDRYNYVESILDSVLKRKNKNRLKTSDKIDRIVTNRWLALPIFAIIMFLVYYISITVVGGVATDWINDGVFGEGWNFFGIFVPSIPDLVSNALNAVHCADWLQGLIIDGAIGGVGSVLGFVPQIFVLFIFLSFLESCGYMSRIAFIMDRIFRKFGLSGKSFIPMLVGTGCGVPAIMASRTIEAERDRRMTIITTTFIPCSAKLPVIACLAGAFFRDSIWVAPSAYFLGIVSIIVSGVILKKTKVFAGKAAPFVMELPAYHMPTFKTIFQSVWERSWSFIKKAATVILVATVLVWFLSSFGFADGKFTMLSEDNLSSSLLAHFGNAIAFIFNPLGFGNWQYTSAVFTGLVAKENIIGTLAVLFGGASTIYKNMTIISAVGAYAYLAFNLLCAPCFAAIGAIRREMNCTKWFWIAIGYQTIFAWLIALLINQIGSLIVYGTFNVWTVIAFTVLAVMTFLFVRPDPYKNNK